MTAGDDAPRYTITVVDDLREPCPCCGGITRSAVGTLDEGGEPVALYAVNWTDGGVTHAPALIDLVLGWRENGDPADCTALAFMRRVFPNSTPSLMVIDATERPSNDPALAATVLRRDEVIGTPLAPRVFAMVDAMWDADARLPREPEPPLLPSPTFITEQSEHRGHCECCGGETRCVIGYLGTATETLCVYWVNWTEGGTHEEGGMIDMIFGPWGDDAGPDGRTGVSLCYRILEDGTPSFMVVDGEGCPAFTPDLAGTILRRDEVIGTPLAPRVFAMVDEIWKKDGRLKHEPTTSSAHEKIKYFKYSPES